ncbi:hypothetical protein ACPW96_18160 [Micromonospora sp. DT81.3]|uniref:hypothetical protein n=1 Tax=Micromonospora sp. DT81.3 TaxID=3416523 RepID=UPI003CEC19CE
MGKEALPGGNTPEQRWMSFVPDGGSEQRIEFAHRGTVRFAVGAPDAHGLVWRVWANALKRDLYLTVRNDVVSKWSFHASGDWRLAHLEGIVKQTGAERIVDQWQRPEPDEHGITHALTIHTDDLIGASPGGVPRPDEVVWLSASAPGYSVKVDIVMVELEHPVGVRADESILGAIPLSDDTIVLIIAGVKPISADLRALHNAHREAAYRTWALKSRSDSRLLFTGQYEAGLRWVWDVAMFPDLVVGGSA